MKYLGVLLPNGNVNELPELNKEMARRSITPIIKWTKAGGFFYLIPEDQVHLLPKDKRGHYLGDDNSGHTIYPIDLEEKFYKNLL